MRFLRVTLAVIAVCAVMLAGPNAEAKKGDPLVKMETSEGTLLIELYKDKAPITVQNFLYYVDSGFYDGLIFHRIVPNFVIQGGGFTKDMMKKTTMPPIENEASNGLKNEKYTLSMARTSDIKSATSQFFINLRDNTNLDHTAKTQAGYGYAVFGKVIEGMDVVDAVGAMPTATKNGMKDVPKTTIEIKRAYRVDESGKEIKKDDKKKAKD